MSTDEQTIGLRLDAVDPLLFRDGRPFDAAARVAGNLPTPQTLAGALRTAMLAGLPGFDFRAFVAARGGKSVHDALRSAGAPDWWFKVRFRGPWPAVAVAEDRVEPLFEKPATLYRTKASGDRPARWAAAVPLPEGALPGWPSGRRPVWKRHEPDPKADGGYLTLAGLRQFLAAQRVADAEVVRRGVLFGDDDRIGIEIDKHDLTSADGMLYAVRFLSLNPKLPDDSRFPGRPVCFYAEVVLPDEAGRADFFAAPTPVPFGGEGKYVGVKKVEAVEWPAATTTTANALWYLASPAFLAGDPPLPAAGGQVVAAASGPGVAVSGWDVARKGPRPTRFAVPAGAVYFVEHPTRLEHDSLDPNADNRLEGWGFALPGTWKEEADRG